MDCRSLKFICTMFEVLNLKYSKGECFCSSKKSASCDQWWAGGRYEIGKWSVDGR